MLFVFYSLKVGVEELEWQIEDQEELKVKRCFRLYCKSFILPLMILALYISFNYKSYFLYKLFSISFSTRIYVFIYINAYLRSQ